MSFVLNCLKFQNISFYISASNGGSDLFLSTNDKPNSKTQITGIDGGFPTDQYEYDRCSLDNFSHLLVQFLPVTLF